MRKDETIKILQTYNTWRRGKAPYDKAGEKCPYSPSEIGQAIDSAIGILSQPYSKQEITEIVDLWEYAQYREPEPIKYIADRMNEIP